MFQLSVDGDSVVKWRGLSAGSRHGQARAGAVDVLRGAGGLRGVLSGRGAAEAGRG